MNGWRAKGGDKGAERSYDDAYYTFSGRRFVQPLFSINSAQDVTDKLVDPMLNLYRH